MIDAIIAEAIRKMGERHAKMISAWPKPRELSDLEYKQLATDEAYKVRDILDRTPQTYGDYLVSECYD